MDTQDRLRVGIVGCGYQGGQMARAIQKVPSLQVTACTDPNHDAAAKLAAAAGHTNIYASIDEMLTGTDVDVVIVATPHHILRDASLAAIRAGKHVLAEKPIGLNEQDAVQVEQAVARAGITYMAGYSFRYIGAWRQVYDQVRQESVGEIQGISAAFTIGRLSSGWNASPETGGGPLLFMGSHLVDQVLWYMQDDPVEVVANVRYRPDTRADEDSAFQIRFARGASAQCYISQTDGGLFHTVDVYGRKGHIGLRLSPAFKWEVTVSGNPAPISLPSQAEDLQTEMHVPELEEFVQAIREHRQPSITVADGRRVLKVLDAVIASGRSCRPIQVA
jgi:predicted dehydrogenase